MTLNYTDIGFSTCCLTSGTFQTVTMLGEAGDRYGMLNVC